MRNGPTTRRPFRVLVGGAARGTYSTRTRARVRAQYLRDNGYGDAFVEGDATTVHPDSASGPSLSSVLALENMLDLVEDVAGHGLDIASLVDVAGDLSLDPGVRVGAFTYVMDALVAESERFRSEAARQRRNATR